MDKEQEVLIEPVSEKPSSSPGENMGKSISSVGKRYVGFDRLKKKVTLNRILKTVFVGLASGYFVSAILLLLAIRIPTPPELKSPLIGVSILLGMVIGGLVGVGVYFIQAKSDMGLAKKFDSDFALKEGMQTSLEFSGDTSTMKVLLDEDLRVRASKVDTKQIKIKKLPLYIVALALSATMAISMVFVPFNVIVEKPEPETPFKLTEMQEAQLEAIAIRVESSAMEQGTKEQVASEVRALKDALKVTSLKSDADQLITLSTEKIDEITRKTGTSYIIHDILIDDDTAFTREIARLITMLDWEKYSSKREKIRAGFEHKEFGTEMADIQKINKETAKKISEASSGLKSALESSGLDTADPLYSELLECAIELELLASDLENGYINYLNTVGSKEGNGQIIEAISNDIFAELDKQNQSYSVGFGASDEIRKMFGMPIPQREDNSSEEKPKDEGETEDEDEDKKGDGGYGEGDVFGSNDLIYDKDKNAHIKYGEVIDIYYQLMGSENYTDEEKQVIQEYFETLFRGLEEEKGE